MIGLSIYNKARQERIDQDFAIYELSEILKISFDEAKQKIKGLSESKGYSWNECANRLKTNALSVS